MTRVLREVRRFAATRLDRGVVAVSGGADSVALLRAICACSAPLVVAHVNHQLRGEESDADEAFVRELCTAIGVEYHVKIAAVAALAAGDNLESTARRVRYEFFSQVANEVGAAWIATAHTADDQAETVLHRLIRGTGLQGLRGIAAERQPLPPTPSPKKGGGVREEGAPSGAASASESSLAPPPFLGEGVGGRGCLLLRPLLALTRADVIAHLAAINQPYRTDSTNADLRFTRNRIRHELLPLLRTFNPDVVSALTHLAEHASEAHEVITAAADELLAKAERPRAANIIVLDALALGTSRCLIRAALRLLWDREGWSVADMTFDAWDRAVEVACRNVGACDFPGGVTMRHSGRVVQLSQRT